MKNFSLKHLIILLSLFVLTGFKVSAQISDTDYSAVQASAGLSTIFCPENATFKLKASADDGGVPALVYTSYEWAEVNSLGGADGIVGATGSELQRTAITPGYHTYRVWGKVDNGNSVVCQSDDYQDFTVYVLPPLTVSASIPNSTVLKYCANAVPGSGSPQEIVITAKVDGFSAARNITAGKTDLAHTDFAYNYQWYRVDGGGARTAVGTNQNTYSVTGADAGSYKYECDITYKVKNTCVAYNAKAQSNGGDAQIIVSPVPGKPTITIM